MITIFEDPSALNFEPISLTRPVFDIRYGSFTLYERLKELCNNKITAFYVRDSLKELAKKKHSNSLLSYEEASNKVWLNGSAIWTKDLIDRVTSSKKSVFVTEGRIVGLNRKCIHILGCLLDSENNISTVYETVLGHIDMNLRKIIEMDDSFFNSITSLKHSHDNLGSIPFDLRLAVKESV